MNSQDVDVVTIAIGDAYQEMAKITVPLMEKHLKTTVRVITEGDPFALKLSLLDAAVKPVLFIDVDAIMLGWDWRPFIPLVFNAVPDYPLPWWCPGMRKHFPTATAINSGVWLADKTHAPVFAEAAKLMTGELKDHRHCMGDQTPLNKALHLNKTALNMLPIDYNYQLPPGVMFPPGHQYPPPSSVHVIHVVGDSVEFNGRPGDPRHKLARLRGEARARGVYS